MPHDYFLGAALTERERLARQAASFEREARSLLDRVAIQPGWQAIDVGCGPIGILNLLAKRVGPDGMVVGLEREARFAEMARRMIAEHGLSNVHIVQGDAGANGLQRGSSTLWQIVASSFTFGSPLVLRRAN